MEISASSVHFAEVVESCLQTFRAQTWQWDYFPSFGSLVTVTTPSRTLFAVVYAVQTGSSDASRSPFTYKKTEAELLSEQPHIFAFLQTTFSCLVVGFLEEGQLIYQTSPQPAKMHAFVSHPSYEDKKLFFSSCNYLFPLFNAPEIMVKEEIVLALLKTKKELGLLTPESFTYFVETISLIAGDDYRRLKILMHRAQPFLSCR